MTLVGRKEILGQIVQIREDLLYKQPSLNRGVLVSGLPLIGKTALVAETVKLSTNYGIPTTTVDFTGKGQITRKDNLFRSYFEQTDTGDRHRYAGEEGKTLLAADVMCGLMISADAPSAKPIYEKPGRWTSDVAANALIEYVEWLQGFLKKPLNVNFERIDQAPAETWEWFQKAILGPAILGSNNLSVMTSRVDYRNLPSLDWDILRRIDTVPLKPLTKEESESLVNNLTLGERTFKNVMPTTGGIPGLIELLVGFDQVVETAKEATGAVLDRVESLNPEAKFLLPAISLLHLVDTEMLMVMANATVLPNADRKMARRQILSNLVATGLLRENYGYGHSLEKGLNAILQTSWQEGHTTEEVKALEAAVALLKERKIEGWDNMGIEIKMAETALQNS